IAVDVSLCETLSGSQTPAHGARADVHNLTNEPNRKRIPVKLSVARFDRSDDHQNRVQNPERDQEWNPNQNNTEHARAGVLDQHRDLKVERFLSVGIDL